MIVDTVALLSGNMVVVNKQCAAGTMGRYLTLLRAEMSYDTEYLNICEVILLF